MLKHRLRMTQSIYGNHPYFLLVDGDAHLGKTDEREPALRDWHRPVGPLR